MAKPRLHLDADVSRKALLEALLNRGHDVTRTPQDDLPLDAEDTYQLLWATAHGRILFTHNIRDFIQMSGQFPNHSGILLAHRQSYSLSQLITLLNCALAETEAEDWVGRVRWLSEWRR